MVENLNLKKRNEKRPQAPLPSPLIYFIPPPTHLLHLNLDEPLLAARTPTTTTTRDDDDDSRQSDENQSRMRGGEKKRERKNICLGGKKKERSEFLGQRCELVK